MPRLAGHVLSRLGLAALVCGVIAGASAESSAAEPAYVGTWAYSAKACGLDQSDTSAPMLLDTRGFGQHEAHCKFTSVRRKGTGWIARAACSVEGDKQKHTFRLEVAGDRLTMSEGGRPSVYVRCKR